VNPIKLTAKISIFGMLAALALAADAHRSNSIDSNLQAQTCELSLAEMEILYRVGKITKNTGSCSVSVY